MLKVGLGERWRRLLLKLKRGLFASGAKQDVIGLKARRIAMRNLVTRSVGTASIDQVVVAERAESLASSRASILTVAGACCCFTDLGATQIGGIERVEQIVFVQSFA